MAKSEVIKDVQSMNIYEKLAEIRKATEVVKKDASGFNYTYVKDETILARITGHMNRLGVSLIPEIEPGSVRIQDVRYTKKKAIKNGTYIDVPVNEVMVSGTMYWTWIDNANPDQKITVPWFFVGQQEDSSQAFGSALTYSARYFKLQYFNIATTNDDPDQWRSQQQASIEKERQETAAEIVKLIDDVSRRVATNDENKNKLKEIIKFHNNGNMDYRKIKDPEAAIRLLDGLHDAFKDLLAVEEKEEAK